MYASRSINIPSGDGYDWDRFLCFQLSDTELPLVLPMSMGFRLRSGYDTLRKVDLLLERRGRNPDHMSGRAITTLWEI